MKQGSAWAWRVDGGLDCPPFSTCLSAQNFSFYHFHKTNINQSCTNTIKSNYMCI